MFRVHVWRLNHTHTLTHLDRERERERVERESERECVCVCVTMKEKRKQVIKVEEGMEEKAEQFLLLRKKKLFRTVALITWTTGQCPSATWRRTSSLFSSSSLRCRATSLSNVVLWWSIKKEVYILVVWDVISSMPRPVLQSRLSGLLVVNKTKKNYYPLLCYSYFGKKRLG